MVVAVGGEFGGRPVWRNWAGFAGLAGGGARECGAWREAAERGCPGVRERSGGVSWGAEAEQSP